MDEEKNTNPNTKEPFWEKRQYTKEVSLEEFRETGLPMYINQILHIFGYAIGFEMDKETHKPSKIIPLRVRFRGFDEDTIERNYEKLARYMKENSKELYDEAHYTNESNK